MIKKDCVKSIARMETPEGIAEKNSFFWISKGAVKLYQEGWSLLDAPKSRKITYHPYLGNTQREKRNFVDINGSNNKKGGLPNGEL
ncbi:MAG: hypothetical protein AB1567_09335 [bacterium]